MARTGEVLLGIYGPDRKPWAGGAVTVQLLDPFSQTKKVAARRRMKAGSDSLLVEKIPADAGQRYSLLVSADGFEDTGLYPVKPEPGKRLNMAAMLVPEKAKPNLEEFSYAALSATSPAFHAALTGAGMDEAQFRALKPEQIAGALNIEAKLRNTLIAGSQGIDFIREIGGGVPDPIRPDRIFAYVDADMPAKVREEIREDGTFRELDESLNEAFHRGFPISFKQQVTFGSLQLSFAAAASANGLLQADIDIDLLTDVGHFGEVFLNYLLKQKTNPFTVYRLLFDQGIAPMYTVKVKGKASSAASA
ncbi:MAG: hypothetical protein JJE04_19125 [Acidobacteriia bacterium]|nr:hypothetical protein [Terriglobia bacterium]